MLFTLKLRLNFLTRISDSDSPPRGSDRQSRRQERQDLGRWRPLFANAVGSALSHQAYGDRTERPQPVRTPPPDRASEAVRRFLSRNAAGPCVPQGFAKALATASLMASPRRSLATTFPDGSISRIAGIAPTS